MLPGMIEILAVLVLFTLELPALSVETFEVTPQVVHSGSLPSWLINTLNDGSKCAICSFLMEIYGA